MEPLRTLVDFPQFQDGSQVGLVFAVVAGVLGLALVRARRTIQGLAGPAWVLAGLAAVGGWFGLPGIWPVPRALLIGLALLVASGELAAHAQRPLLVGAVLAAPGAALVARSEEFLGPGWVPWLVFGVTVLGAPAAADLDRRLARLGLGPVLLAVSVAGLYATVPDTELSRALLGAALPVALLGWPLRVARIGAGGAGASVALLLWVAAVDGYGRPGSIVGAAGALGLLLTEAYGRRIGRSRIVGLARLVSVGALELAVVFAQVMLTMYAARIAGFEQDGGTALLLLAPALAVGVGLGAVLGISSRARPRPRRRRPVPKA